MNLKRLTLAFALAIAGLAMLGSSPATAAPIWNLDLHHMPTNFAPGQTGEYTLDVDNVGPDPSSGTLTLTVTLPAGMTFVDDRQSLSEGFDDVWSCPTAPGSQLVTCTTADPIPRYGSSRGLILAVDVTGSPGVRFAQANLSGGGAPAPPTAFERTTVSATPAPFHILAETFTPDFTDADGLTPERSAGARPELLSVPFDFATIKNSSSSSDLPVIASGSIRNLTTDLPPGFLGDPTAVGECEAALLTLGDCPPASQLGVSSVKLPPFLSVGSFDNPFIDTIRPVYNMVNPFGSLSDLGFTVAGNPVHVKASLDPARSYAITTDVNDINETFPPFNQRLTIWGVPADPAHDAQRCPGGVRIDTSIECASDGPLEPFLTVPGQCGVDLQMMLHSYDSWQSPGDFGEPIAHELDSFEDCEDVPFEPTVSVAPTTDAADSPSGLDVQIDLPQHNSCEIGPPVECEIATSALKDATVELPEGLVVNPASANGLDACTEAEIGLGTDEPVTCPDASKIADVEVITPALPDPVEGLVYLATPFNNPFDTLLAGYIVLADPARGLLVKIPGQIDVDEDTGQLSGTFEDNPQLPFSEFDLHFKGGAHSSLITPKTCGNYSSSGEFAPWSGNPASEVDNSFAITRAPGGGSCPSSESSMPHEPDLDVGTVRPVAGVHSPFIVNLRREDGSQRFGEVTVKPPPGLTAKLAGTPYCSDSALARAEDRAGKAEQSNPSCPAASEIGRVWAAAGAGPSPYWAPGTAYLSGPYKGAPLSMAIITPATAGPFDLGTVVIRTALHVDPRTAEITAVSDEIPQMLEGIPLNVRAASINLNKPDFSLNPTNCNPMQITGELVSTVGQSADLQQRFQLGECRRLGFKPRLYLRLFGKRFNRSANPRLRAILVPRPGDANIAFASVKMPNSIFLDQDHIRTICTRAQFATDTCPARARYGSAAATTPLLDQPLRGPVYLRSSDNPLPDLVSDLRGQVRVEAIGRTDSVKGALRNTFDIVPDAPVTKFVLNLQAGNKSLLVASKNLCRGVQRALLIMRSHANQRLVTRQPIAIPRCRAIRKAAKRRAAKRKRARQRARSRAARRASISTQRAVR